MRNYVGVWQLHRPEELALVAGSVFIFDCSKNWSDADMKALKDVMMTGVGRRKEEGFGQIRPWMLNQSYEIKKENKASKSGATIAELSEHTKGLMSTILATSDVEAIRANEWY